MVPMIDIYHIKHLFKKQNKSLRQISQLTGHSFRTVTKYVDMDEFNIPSSRKSHQSFSKIDAFRDILITWIKNDLNAPRKQRHTIARMQARLEAEFADQYTAKYRTLCEYVTKLKKELNIDSNEMLIPLKHNPGTAQLDFGETTYLLNGNTINGYHLVISFPFSNMGFVQLFPAQNQEALFQGMKSIFEHIGGVPKEIWFDNMSTAVVKVGKGENRILTDLFMRFSAHYGFEPKFCNPAKGNEKGSVERKVGYLRSNFFVPVPEISSLEEYNKELLLKSDEDGRRSHYKKEKNIEELFEEDKLQLIPLNEIAFTVFKQEKLKVNNIGYIRFKGNSYSVKPSLSKQEVWIKIYYDKLEILDEKYKLITTHKRSYGKNQEFTNWELWKDAFVQKPRAFEHCEYFENLPEFFREYFKNQTKSINKKKLLTLIGDFLVKDSLELAMEVLKNNIEQNILDVDSFKAAYLAKLEPNKIYEPLDLTESIPQVLDIDDDLREYDKILGGM